jgi:PKD domain
VAAAANRKVLRRAVALLASACLLAVAGNAGAEEAPGVVDVTEATAVTDAVTVTVGQIVGTTEGVAIGDGTGTTRGALVGVGEPVSIGDGTGTVTGERVAVGEGVGIGDGTNVRKGQTVDLDEGVVIGDGTEAEGLNVVPTVQLTAFTGVEGAAAGASGSFTDPDPQQWTATVDYGDGSGQQPLPLAADKTFQLSHVYDDNGSYLVTVVVKDNAGGSGTGTAAVTIANQAPTATLANAGPVDEGSPATITFANQADVSAADTAAGFTYRYACDGQSLGAPTGDATVDCTFDDDGTHTVLARILDKDGGHSDYTTDVVIRNVAPTAELANDGPVAEAAPSTISFAGQHDPSSADTAAGFRYRYACDGVTLGPPSSNASATCSFDDGPSQHTVLARIADDDGGFTDYTTVVRVENAAPAGVLANSGPAAEGSPVTVSWSGQTDPSNADTSAGFKYRYACDGVTLGAATTDASMTCTFDDGPSTHTVLSQIVDKDGGFADRTTVVTVQNVAPTARLVTPTNATDEGLTFALALVDPTDPSEADVAAGLTLEYDCGLGAGYQPGATCTARENPSQAVKARVTDKDGGSTEYTATVSVRNVAPSVTITAPPSGAVYQVGEPIWFTGTFTDPGVLDTHTATWSFDGVDQAGSVTEAGGSGTTGLLTSFSAPGVYSVRLTVADDDGSATTASTVDGLDAFVVVYDPSAGFVIGSGWINSPAGAYPADPTATGKATFGFVSKYAKGATVPTGNTEFKFKAVNLDFSSTSYQWLVVAGSKAQFKGSGAVNGTGGYGFMLTGVDGTPDRLRMKVWNASGQIVYDNVLGAADDADEQSIQALGSGSIVIQR